jgi:hypothetical protein
MKFTRTNFEMQSSNPAAPNRPVSLSRIRNRVALPPQRYAQHPQHGPSLAILIAGTNAGLATVTVAWI